MSDEVLRTLILAISAVAVAFFGWLGARAGIRRQRRKRRLDVDVEESEAVEKYTSDPGQFVHDVLESNRQLTKRVEAAETKATELEAAFDAFRSKDRKFRNALARWFVDIMAAFENNHIEMPYPRTGDEELLSDVIPSALEATRPRPPRTV